MRLDLPILNIYSFPIIYEEISELWPKNRILSLKSESDNTVITKDYLRLLLNGYIPNSNPDYRKSHLYE